MNKAFTKLFAFYQSLGQSMGVPDALAAAAVIWPDYVLETTPCYGEACTNADGSYGQIILYQEGAVYEMKVTLPDGTERIMNFRLNANDIETIRLLMKEQG